MCTQPRYFDGQPVACRECDQCVASRIGDWLARGVAESASAGYTLVVRLSYRNLPDGSSPSGAVAFKYRDVSNWLKALREAYFRHYNQRGEIRYLVAGERGSKGTTRVHYHVLLWSDRALDGLGDIKHFATGRDLATLPLKRNVEWTLWRHGHVFVQRPDAGGIAYVLKYAVKDQFNVVKSKGHSREAKSEIHGAGLFRMSKKPPIGWRWLERRMAEHEAAGTVPVSLDLKVPGLRGYYYPRGEARRFVLERCYAIAQDRNERFGAPPAGWETLLASVSTNLKDWETLTYGPDYQITAEERAAEYARWHEQFRQELLKREGRFAAVLRGCTGGGCEACRNTVGAVGVRAAKERDEQSASRYASITKAGWSAVSDKAADRSVERRKERYAALVPTHVCQFRRSPDVRKAFRTARHIDRLNRAIRGRHVPREGDSEV